MTTVVNLPADKFDTAMNFVKPDNWPSRVDLAKLAVLPGFNTRVKDADYSERVVAIAESIVANGFFEDKPFAVTMLPNDETVYIYDGEHRFDAAKQALLDGAEFPEGLPVAWAKDGATVKDLTIHLAHGNNGERLNMVELAAVVRRMQGLDMDKDEIAAALGRTTRHVDNLFVLAAANSAVKKAVASGQIAGAEAVKLLRKDKTTAAAKIAEHVAAAVAKGKAKATPKTMTAESKPAGPKTKTVPMSMNFVPGKKMADMLKEIATMVREFVEFDKGTDVCSTAALVRFSVTTVDREAEAAAKKAAEDKAAAAAKREADKKAADEKRAADKKIADDKKAADKKAAEAKKAADKKAADAKKAKEAKALAAATAKAATGAAKKAGTTAKATGAKAAPATKTAEAAQKPAESDSGSEGTTTAPEAEIAPEGASSPDDDGMGGL